MKAILGMLAVEDVFGDCNMSSNEWSILHQNEIVLETMAQVWRVLDGKRYHVTMSMVPVAMY